MKKLLIIAAVAACYTVSISSFAASSCQAPIITFTAYSHPDTKNVRIGNMVDPSTGSFWTSAPAGNKSWTWKVSPDCSNLHKFALKMNYQKTAAHGYIVIDPKKMKPGVVTNVELNLQICGSGNGFMANAYPTTGVSVKKPNC